MYLEGLQTACLPELTIQILLKHRSSVPYLEFAHPWEKQSFSNPSSYPSFPLSLRWLQTIWWYQEAARHEFHRMQVLIISFANTVKMFIFKWDIVEFIVCCLWLFSEILNQATKVSERDISKNCFQKDFFWGWT